MNIFRFNSSAVFVTATLIGGLLSTTASASPLVGTLQISGNVIVNNSTGGTIDFIPAQAGMNVGTEFVNLAQNTGTFTVFNMASAPTAISVQNLTNGAVGPFSLPNFITLGSTLPGAHFDLTYITLGSDPSVTCLAPATVGQLCSPPNSPFNFQNVATGAMGIFGSPCTVTMNPNNNTSSNCATLIGFQFGGNAVSGTGDVSSFIGSVTTQDNTHTFQELLQIVGNGGNIGDSFSGTITATATPEPGSFVMLLAGIGMFTFGAFGKKHIARD